MTDLKERLDAASRLVSPEPDGFERLAARRERARRRQRVSAAVLALVLAMGVLAALASLLPVGRSNQPGGTPHETGGELGVLPPAARALEPGEYYYDRVVTIFPGGRVDAETWWGLDDSGRLRVNQRHPEWGLWPDGVFGPGEFGYPLTDLSILSTDAATLERQLRDRSEPDGASPQPVTTPDPGDDPMGGEVWRAFRDLIQMPNATPDLRAALLQVAAGLDGSEVREDAVDPAGRPATLLRSSSRGLRYDVYFDPSTLQVMSFVTIDIPEAGPSRYQIWIASGITSSTDEVPEGDDALIPGPVGPLPTL